MIMFSDKLKFLRKHQELTQAEVAKQINIDHTTYCRYEKGVYQPDFDTLKRIAKFFNVSIDYLLENENIVSDREDVVDFNQFVMNGRYTVHSKFPTHKERKVINKMVNAIFELRERDRER